MILASLGHLSFVFFFCVCLVHPLHVIYLPCVFLFSHLSSVLHVRLFALCAFWPFIYHINYFPCYLSCVLLFSPVCSLSFYLPFLSFSLYLHCMFFVLLFALCVHSLHLPYVLCSFPFIYTVSSSSFCLPCVYFSLPIHFFFALCASAPSIQVNGTMRNKNGHHHHHHVSFVLSRRRPVRGQCVPTDLFREQRRQVVHL